MPLRRRSSLLLLAAAAGAGGQAVAQPPAPPPARWVVNAGEKKCELVRASNSGKELVFQLGIEPATEAPTLMVPAPKGWRGPGSMPAEVALSPRGIRIPATALRLTLDSGTVLNIHGLQPAFFDQFGAARGMAVKAGGREMASANFGGARPAVRALRECHDGLLRSWGVDPKLLASLQRKPQPLKSRAALFLSGDYPIAAINRGSSGISVVRFTVGTDGKPSGCVTVSPSGDEALDRASCAIMLRRGRYAPAIGADGKPVAVPQVYSVVWVIPTG
ncbi:MAG TPA: energy transducer TonB [Allosphingosinicella sp.]